MKRLSFIVLLFLVLNVFGQNVIISGFVTDKNSGEPLIGATVFALGTNIYAFSDNYGYFSLALPKHKVVLAAQYVGYFADTVSFIPDKDTTINFSLLSRTHLQEVVVTAYKTDDKLTQTGVITLSGADVKLLPALAGESDIIKSLQMMPGVVEGNEGSSAMIVRGGSPDQNLIVLDDVPLYYVNHLGGFISVFNTDAINNATLYKGSYPARYGGRLSSVLDVSLRNGNMKKKQGNVTAGFLVSKLTLEYPLVQNKSSVLLSFRTAPVGWAIKPVSYFLMERTFYFYYTFYDLNMKWNYIINRRNRLFLSFYAGDDEYKLGYRSREDSLETRGTLNWGNRLLAFRWNHEFSSRVFFNMNVNYTFFRYGYLTTANDLATQNRFELENLSGIKDLAVINNLHFNIGKNTFLSAGSYNVYHNFIPYYARYNVSLPSQNIFTDSVLSNQKITAFENDFFVEIFKDLGKMSFNLGIRANNFYLPDSKLNFFFPEPRLNLRIAPWDNFSIKIAYAQTSQFVNRVFVQSASDLPVDLWLPASNSISPAKSNQWAAGVYKSFKSWEFSVEGFYKKMSDLAAVLPGSTLMQVLSANNSFLLNNGAGHAYGVEVFLKKYSGKTTGWISYTYSRSFRQFPAINNGEPYPYHYDRPHSIKLVLIRKLRPGITFSLDWIYGSGYPYTKPIGYIPDASENIPSISFEPQLLWEPLNSSRMEAYHRLDFAFRFSKQKKNGTRTWTVGLYNAYNHLNPYYYYIDARYDPQNGNYRWSIYKYTLFPMMPIISYSFKW